MVDHHRRLRTNSEGGRSAFKVDRLKRSHLRVMRHRGVRSRCEKPSLEGPAEMCQDCNHGLSRETKSDLLCLLMRFVVLMRDNELRVEMRHGILLNSGHAALLKEPVSLHRVSSPKLSCSPRPHRGFHPEPEATSKQPSLSLGSLSNTGASEVI